MIRIGRLGLLDGAKIAVIDRTLSPPAASIAYIDTLAIEHVDTTNPAARSNVRMKAKLDQAELTLDGWALPFQPKPDFELRAKVSELVLPSVNPYAGPAIGLDIVDGKLIANAEARADAGQLKGEIRAKVIDLGFADRPEAGSDRISRSVGVPLSTIIDLLQDADGSIDLTLPFEGDLLSPEFDYSDMIWSGVFRVLRALIVSPFKLISASVSLLTATGDAAGAEADTKAGAPPQLAPVPFAPAQETLGPEGRSAVAALQQVLQARPKLRLRLCGVATREDQDALFGRAETAAKKGVPPPDAIPQMRLVAEARMRAVGSALSADGGISPSQLLVCPEPRIDPADPGPPRVDIGL